MPGTKRTRGFGPNKVGFRFDDLDPKQQRAALTLGWTKDTWDRGDTTPFRDYWETLGSARRQAAAGPDGGKTEDDGPSLGECHQAALDLTFGKIHFESRLYQIVDLDGDKITFENFPGSKHGVDTLMTFTTKKGWKGRPTASTFRSYIQKTGVYKDSTGWGVVHEDDRPGLETFLRLAGVAKRIKKH
jgi:hypothetical protein